MKYYKTKICAIILSTIAIVACAYLYNYQKNERILSVDKISLDEFNEIKSTHQETTFEYITLYLNDQNITGTYYNDFYILQREENIYNGNLSLIGGRYKKAIYDQGKSKLELMKNSEPLQLIIYDNESYQVINIYMTYIPIVEITGSQKVEEVEGEIKSIYSANMALYSYEDDVTYNRESFNILDHVKGNSTIHNTKKNFRISLKKSNGKSLNKSLLGMREDGDWVLLSMGQDGSMIKEKLSMDIYSLVTNGKYSCEMKYVELFMDNEYKGLYLLCEHLDIKQLNGEKSDYLVSIRDNYRDIYEDVSTSKITKSKTGTDKWILNEIQVKNASEEDFEDISNIDQAIHDIYFDKDNNLLKFDYQNCLEYGIFIQMTKAIDNMYKNQRLLLHKDGESYDVIKAAWDFDWNYLDNPLLETDAIDYLLPSSIKDSEEYYSDSAKLYEEQKYYYNSKTLVDMIEEYNQYIINSGASNRIVENSIYLGEYEYDKAVEELKEIVSKRVDYCDEYYSNLLKED